MEEADAGRGGSGSREMWRWSYLTMMNPPTTCGMRVFHPESSKLGHRLQSPTTCAILVTHERTFWVRPQTRESAQHHQLCQLISATRLLRRTRKQSSLGKTRNGSFFSLGLTNPCKKLSRLLSHVSTSDANQVSLSATLS